MGSATPGLVARPPRKIQIFETRTSNMELDLPTDLNFTFIFSSTALIFNKIKAIEVFAPNLSGGRDA